MNINKFLKNDAFILIVASAFSQIILIVTIPLISRLYTPSEFGYFTVFSNLASIFIPIINARYDLLIINSKSKQEANGYAVISFIISLFIVGIITVFTFVYALFYNHHIFDLVLLSILLILVSLTNIFTNYLNLLKKYNLVSLITVLRTVLMVSIQIIFGYIFHSAYALMAGFSMSYIAGIFIGYKHFKMIFQYNYDRNYLLNLFKDNLSQLIYSSPSILINSITFSLSVFLISIIYSNHDTGIYGMGLRILTVPVVVAGLGLSKLFMQQAHLNYQKYGSFRTILKKYTVGLIILGLSIYLPFYLLGGYIISFVLGEQWSGILEISLPLMILCFVRLIVSTVSLANIVISKQKMDLLFQFSIFLFTCLSCLSAFILKLTLVQFVYVNCMFLCVCYIVYYLKLYKYS
ncbi:lipopolysaccharide biosynthesis protein [Macrococcus sp. DPC7161]|uniref:lipopolysaccharide biosynthesis protein n=1 Tax=Macrococcus sp. DPC7161 TaxID=2507060 RepID=UPI00100B8187|nr:oligosaccharide flippase family protein [Macrococcus sp. DPC7161]RXK17229.1 capsular biosynthesis protein [Macrococcus sp. DPC7161]